MGAVTIVVIAVGLAMDAFAVSIASAAAFSDLKMRQALRMALSFGAFQAVMPLIGSLAGLGLKEFIAGADHWVAFALLVGVGVKMLYEAAGLAPKRQRSHPADGLVLLSLSIATSIDALAVGVTLSLLAARVLLAAAVIGIVTFCLSYLGTVIGKKLGHFFESKIEAVAGVVLIAIGGKILIEHLVS